MYFSILEFKRFKYITFIIKFGEDNTVPRATKKIYTFL